MPIINLENGTILDMGHGNGNNTLEKRSGSHFVTVWSGTGCEPRPAMVAVQNFQCSSGCFNLNEDTPASSVLIYETTHANPYPSVTTFTGQFCEGDTQNMGVVDRSSCTDTSTNGFRSFIPYFDCHH